MRFGLTALLAALLVSRVSLAADAARPLPVLVVVGMLDEARIVAGPGVRVVISAGDPDLLARRLARYSRRNVRAVISMGIAGGLDPAGQTGDLYLSNRVVTTGGEWDTDLSLEGKLAQAAAAAGLAVNSGADAGMDGVVASDPASRQILRDLSAADIVDTESQHAAAFAAQEGLPFGVARVLADPASFTLPPAALLPLSRNGAPDIGAVFWSLLQDPEQFGALIQVSQQEQGALSTLQQLRAWMNVPAW